jgi:hypothetical protein
MVVYAGLSWNLYSQTQLSELILSLTPASFELALGSFSAQELLS